MRRAILIIVLILSIFQIGGCVVISCDEYRHRDCSHAECIKADLTVHEALVIGF
jgi:hypothetical protein